MPISDSEPRYRLLDSGGNIVASFYLDDSDGFNIQEATNNNEVTLASDGTFTTPALDTDELPNVADVVIDASESWSDIKTRVEAANSGDTIKFGSGSYSPDATVQPPEASTVDIRGCDFTVVDGYTGGVFASTHSSGGVSPTYICYGATADGRRSTLAAGEGNTFIGISGDNTATDDIDNFVKNPVVLGGEFHDFSDHGVAIRRSTNGVVRDVEGYNMGESGDSSNSGDTVDADVVIGLLIENIYAHDNARHGVTVGGTGLDRSLRVTIRDVVCEDNGNDGINVESCQDYTIEGTTRGDGQQGLHLKGTGKVDATVVNSGSYPLFNVKDYRSSPHNITGETGGNQVRGSIEVRDPGSHGLMLSGPAGNSEVWFDSVTVTNATATGSDGIQGNGPDVHIDNVRIDTVAERGIYLGNDSSIQWYIGGGKVEGWNQDAGGYAGIEDGNSIADGCHISCAIGTRGGSSGAGVNITEGNHHRVDATNPNGYTVVANGADSIIDDA